MAQERYTAEDYAAEAMAQDYEKWVVYNPRVNEENFDDWLEVYPPSGVSREDGYGWISVVSPHDAVQSPRKERVVELQEAWEQLQKSGRPINLRTITELAMTYGICTGKWLFHVETGVKVDYLWSLVARGVIEGKLGMAAKVSSYNPNIHQYAHVVCMYNTNFTDEEEVYMLENAIRGVGIKCPMSYKPDVYTYIGVYRNNKWGLRPTIYDSVYDILAGCSKVTTHRS